MKIQVPFTDIKISIGLDPTTSQSRGTTFARGVTEPDRAVEGVKISANEFFKLWRNNADIFGCVREITETSGIGGFRFYNPRDEKKETQASSQAIKKVIDLLEYQYEDGLNVFKERVFEQYLIAGNAYIEKIRNLSGKEILGVKVLDARTFQIVTDEFGNVYKYIQGSPYNMWDKEKHVVFDRDDIIHWKKGIDPNSEAFGFSPMETVLFDSRSDYSAAVANYNSFENQAVPAVQYILDDNLSEEQVRQAVETIRTQFKGSKNRGKSGVLAHVKEIKQIQLSNSDMQYIEGRKFSTEKICTAYGVPKVILGYTEGVNFTNHEGQMKKFYDGTIRKYEDAFEYLFNRRIIKECLGLEDQIAFEFNEATFDTDEVLWRRAIDARMSGLVTTNGARKIIGKDPIDESKHGDLGDVVYSGIGANSRFLTDVGIDPLSSIDSIDNLKKSIQLLDEQNVSEGSK